MYGIHDLTLFMISGLLLNLMPGPDSLLIMTRSARQGWRAGSAAALGIGAGTMVHIFAAALGLSALLATSATAFVMTPSAAATMLVPSRSEAAAKPAAISMSKSHFHSLLYHRIASKIYLGAFQDTVLRRGYGRGAVLYS